LSLRVAVEIRRKPVPTRLSVCRRCASRPAWLATCCPVGYGPNLAALCRRSAHYVASILRSTPQGELPIEQPTVFEFAVNLKTARQLGITLPPSILARADEVIE
jgi:ABC-type uncharacterized transport system substrate-binding protein